MERRSWLFTIPQPSYPLHILLVAKQPFATLLDVPDDATDFMRELFETVQALVREFNLEQSGYRLITNGGSYQDIPHLHFHLVAEEVSLNYADEYRPGLSPQSQQLD